MLVCIVAGAYVGVEIGTAEGYEEAAKWAAEQVARDINYYERVCSNGGPSPLTQEKAVELLTWMRNEHQRWVDHPEWYDHDPDRLSKEKSLVRVYGKLIDFVRGQ